MATSPGVDRRAVILTALPVEYRAVCAHLEDTRTERHPEGDGYELGRFRHGQLVWTVAVGQSGPGNVPAATATERMVSHFEPQIAILVGVAGGVKDVELGDVVAATKIYDYASGKDGRSFQPRPDVRNSSHRLIQSALAVAKGEAWLARRKTGLGGGREPEALVEPIASGDVVVADTQSSTYTLVREQYGDAVVVEMEGWGFADAVSRTRGVEALVVRGVSDLVDDKSREGEAEDQETAAHHAAAFAFEVLARLASTGTDRPPRGRMGPTVKAFPPTETAPRDSSAWPPGDPWSTEPREGESEVAGPGVTHPALVWVPGGHFTMGGRSRMCSTAAEPHDRTIAQPGFWMQKHLVTNLQYVQFLNLLGSTGHDISGCSVWRCEEREIDHGHDWRCSVFDHRDDFPVIGVDWESARAYAHYFRMRLPAEEEWEYAARGPEGRAYPWKGRWRPSRCCNKRNPGPAWDPYRRQYASGHDPDAYGWLGMYERIPKTTQTIPCPLPADAKTWRGGEPRCGAVDMAGNLMEWCEAAVDTPHEGLSRVVRGGNYAHGRHSCLSFCRCRQPEATNVSNSVGFRCVVTPKPARLGAPAGAGGPCLQEDGDPE